MEPELWRWVWLAAAVAFTVGELSTPGSFFLGPFAVGGGVAAVLAFAGVPVVVTWIVFLVVSAAVFAALRPLARRLDAEGGNPRGVGSSRLIGESAVVLEAIPPGPSSTGLVRIGREEWRAESADGTSVDAGSTVTVLEVRGTRVLVHTATRPHHAGPPLPPST